MEGVSSLMLWSCPLNPLLAWSAQLPGTGVILGIQLGVYLWQSWKRLKSYLEEPTDETQNLAVPGFHGRWWRRLWWLRCSELSRSSNLSGIQKKTFQPVGAELWLGNKKWKVVKQTIWWTWKPMRSRPTENHSKVSRKSWGEPFLLHRGRFLDLKPCESSGGNWMKHLQKRGCKEKP